MNIYTWILGIVLLVGIVFFLLKYRGFPQRYPALINFEVPLPGAPDFIPPEIVVDSLAIYRVGEGDPVLLMPYPHAHTREPMAQSPLAQIIVSLGYSVVSFDVPGAYRSTRSPVGDMVEMLNTALEALDALGIDGPVDVVGHSMGSLVALAFAIEHPERVSRLVLVGSMSGFPDALRYGMPRSTWKISDPAYWRFISLGLKVKSGFGTLADHKALCNIMSLESLYDPGFFVLLKIEVEDKTRGIPIREILWGKQMFKWVDYAGRLTKVQAPTLILVGKHDPVTPLPCSERLHQGITGSQLVVFESSGHSPFVEEPENFYDVLKDFLSEDLQDSHKVIQ